MSDLKDFVIENGVLEKYNGREADVTVPNGIVSIKDKAFARNNSLRSVRFPDSVEWIGGNAFKRCMGLQSITLGNAVKSIMRSAFCGCTNLTEITLPDSLEFVGYRIFECCVSLRKIHAPNGLPNLTEASEDFLIKLRLGGIEIENELLRRKLRKYIKRNRNELFQQALYKDSPEIVTLILSMYDRAELDLLEQMIGLANEKQNAAITSLLIDYKNKNYTAEDIENIEIEKTEKELGFRDRTPSDWRKLFKIAYWEGSAYINGYKSKEKTAEIPSQIGKTNIRGIACEAFRFNSDIKTVFISEGVTAIGDYAFDRCPELTEIILPSSIRYIGRGAFDSCHNLTGITVPNGVTEIGWHAFHECTNFTSIIIPDSVIRIDDDAFEGCERLVIRAPVGSYAERYAEEHNIKYVSE